jgi:hypothetical protein
MSYTMYDPARETIVIAVGVLSAPAGMVIEKSAPGNKSVAPSGPTTAETV